MDKKLITMRITKSETPIAADHNWSQHHHYYHYYYYYYCSSYCCCRLWLWSRWLDLKYFYHYYSHHHQQHENCCGFAWREIKNRQEKKPRATCCLLALLFAGNCRSRWLLDRQVPTRKKLSMNTMESNEIVNCANWIGLGRLTWMATLVAFCQQLRVFFSNLIRRKNNVAYNQKSGHFQFNQSSYWARIVAKTWPTRIERVFWLLIAIAKNHLKF